MQTYILTGAGSLVFESPVKGKIGGHRKSKIYGRLDCRVALRWIARGHYVKHRVFFADEDTAIAAGYRPCANCMRENYTVWKSAGQGCRAGLTPIMESRLTSLANSASLQPSVPSGRIDSTR